MMSMRASTVGRLRMLFVAAALVVSKVAPALSSSENLVKSMSELLEAHDCNVTEAFASVNKPSNTKVLRGSDFGLTPMDKGGFGAQLCLNWIPQSIHAMFHGARYVPRFADSDWNYGCPSHETANKVLLNALPAGDNSHDIGTGGMIVRGSDHDFKEPVHCKGKELPLEVFRGASATHWVQFQPQFRLIMDRIASQLSLPPAGNFLAVHIRGGDKLASEWRGAFGGYSKPQTWANAIAETVQYERDHFTAALSNDVFVESDDCKFIFEVKRLLPEHIRLLHLPCQLKAPSSYTQRGQTVNVTGHNQWAWNSERSCMDTAKYFLGLDIFRASAAVLLSKGGTKGTNPSGMGKNSIPSNTVILIENLRRSTNPPGRNYNMDPKGQWAVNGNAP